ncbi:MAG: tRNA epoxyqueuosine(34) reductase QueG [Bryobacterales bacterium]|nr:tRNA epoxyqueuosine(34) reductase QueG [Bryobacterales bacterium]
MIQLSRVRELAAQCGLELAGAVPAGPVRDFTRYQSWVAAGFAGRMGYLTDHRGALRQDPRNLLPSARSVIVAGKLYQTDFPDSKAFTAEYGWISRYAWGEDYHDLLRHDLERLRDRLREETGEQFDARIAVDTAPLLERSLAHLAGLGWIGKNTCLINEQTGSWYFLGELLTSLEIEPGSAPPDRCGTCTRCIDACPTSALVPYELDARRCISYLTIELRGPIDEQLRHGVGSHVFGCDICQQVCPWNRRAPSTDEAAFQPEIAAPPLEELAALSEDEFRAKFRHTALWRARYRGMLRNVAVAMGNSRLERFREPLTRLAAHSDPDVAGHAKWALARLNDRYHEC